MAVLPVTEAPQAREAEVVLTIRDFFFFAAGDDRRKSLRAISWTVGAAACAGAALLSALRGPKQGGVLLAAAMVWTLWPAFSGWMAARQMYRRSKNVLRMYYRMNDEGLAMHPSGREERRIPWDKMRGARYARRYVALYPDADHAYILPRRCLGDPEAWERDVRAWMAARGEG